VRSINSNYAVNEMDVFEICALIYCDLYSSGQWRINHCAMARGSPLKGAPDLPRSLAKRAIDT